MFCTKCGYRLYESDTFCTKCGAEVGVTPTQMSAPQNVQHIDSKRSTTLWVIIIFAAGWAILGIYSGLSTLLNAHDMVYSALTPDILDQLETIGFDPQTLVDVFTIVGALILISGIMSLMTAILVFIRKQHTVALILCIIGSVLMLIGLFGIIGLIVAYFLNKSKHEFAPSKKGTL